MLLSYQFMLSHKTTPAYIAYASLKTCFVQPSNPAPPARTSPQPDLDRAEPPSISLQKTGFAMKNKFRPAPVAHYLKPIS